MKKIKVLAVMSDRTSVGHFRSGWPGAYIRDNFNEEIEIKVLPIEDIMVWDMIELSQYDVIHFNRLFGYIESFEELFPLIRSHGVKMVMDIDDYWHIPDEFPAKKYMLETLGGSADVFEKVFKNVDCITTTTELFRDVLLEHNSNVVVLPNAIDLSHRMWQFETEPSDVVRIAWLGSNQRHHDLLRLVNAIAKLYADPELKGKFRFVQAGGEGIDNSIFDGPDFKWLKQAAPFEYGVYYKEVDICLAPLKENKYNQCKSEIKMVEAGMNKKAFVGQSYGIYKEHITHGVNGFLVDDDEKWYSILKALILDKGTRERVSQNLHEYVNPKFALDTIARKRVQFYKSLCNEK